MTTIGALIVVGGGAYVVLDNVTTVTLPTVKSPDMTTSFSKSETPAFRVTHAVTHA